MHQMGDRLKDIRHTTSDAVEILRKLGSPEVYGSLEKISQTTQEVKGIMVSIMQPEMVKNIENMRLAVEAIENTSRRVETLVIEIKKTGFFEKASETLAAARNSLTSEDNKKNMSEVMAEIREMLLSITSLIDELKLTINTSKKSGLLHDVGEAAKEASDFYHTVKE
jgi:hypothetical protein